MRKALLIMVFSFATLLFAVSIDAQDITPVGGFSTATATFIPPPTTTPGPNDIWAKSITFHPNTCFNITEGAVEYGGLMFTESGHLSASIRLPISVTPSQVIFHFTSPLAGEIFGNPPPYYFSTIGSLHVFGIQGYYSYETDDTNWSSAFHPATAGVSGTDINFTFETSGTSTLTTAGLTLDEIWVQGRGPNPFANLPDEVFNASEFLPCYAGATATPAPPTATATPTDTLIASPTPSDTLTPTATFTPTQTGIPTWECSLDFTEDDWNFQAMEDQGVWTPGVGWEATVLDVGGSPNRWYTLLSLFYHFGAGVEFSSMSFTFEKSLGTLDDLQVDRLWKNTDNTDNRLDTRDAAANLGGTWGYTGSFGADYIGVVLTSGYTTSSPSGSVVVSGAYMTGYNTNPFTGCEEPTATPTLTLTSTPTHTPNPNATATLTPYNANVTPGTPGPSPTPSNTRLPIMAPPTYTLPPLGTLPPTTTPFPTTTPLVTATTGTPVIITTIVVTVPAATLPALPGDDSAGGLPGLGGSLAAFLTNTWNQAMRYLREMSGRATGMIDTWRTAPIRAIPGLPQCASNRLASELCAIYYILTYTIFSGLLGGLILPAILIVIDIRIILRFVVLVRAVLGRLAEIIKI